MPVDAVVRWGQLERAQLALEQVRWRLNSRSRMACALDENSENVLVLVITAGGQRVQFSENVNDFPSDALIAQIALVA